MHTHSLEKNEPHKHLPTQQHTHTLNIILAEWEGERRERIKSLKSKKKKERKVNIVYITPL